jgi:predicted restriction endonuclease
MSSGKKRTRQQFRDAVFGRDGHKCRVCGDATSQLDAHHITDRNLMPNGGYCAPNGISLCPLCHEKAEAFHSTGTAMVGFAPDDLYQLIGSSHVQAVAASERLK